MSRPLGYGGKGTIHRSTNSTGAARTAPKYPHPFFDQGQAYLPTSVKNMFHWCRFYFLTNPAVHAAITKMAEYPVTPIIFKTENDALRKKYQEISRLLGLKTFRVEVGLDYYTYGNAYASLMFPFTKFLVCGECGTRSSIKDPKTKYKWVSSKYQLTCRHCGHIGFAKPHDQYRKSIRGIRLMRWNPEAIDIKFDEITGQTTYLYDIPKSTLNEIAGKKALENLPDVFIQAARKRSGSCSPSQPLSLRDRCCRRRVKASACSFDAGPQRPSLPWDTSLTRGVAQEHRTSAHRLSAGRTATSDPYSMVNLGEWKKEVQRQLSQWKIDPNRIPVMPLPLGYQTIGGNGRALVLHNEYRVWSEHIVAGMGVPPEFVFGGIQYSGTNLTMFQLQNKFLSYIEDQRELVFDFIFKRIAAFMDYPDIDGDFRPFKMADDLQRTMLYFQLVQDRSS